MDQQRNPQFSLATVITLMTATAIWFWFVFQGSGWKGPGIVMLTALTVGAGMVGHTLYTFVLPIRFVVVAVVSFVALALPAFLLFFLAGSADLPRAAGCMLEAIIGPARALVTGDSMLERSAIIKCWLTTGLLLPAHAIRPNWATAIITSLGVAAWFSTGFLLATASSFGA